MPVIFTQKNSAYQYRMKFIFRKKVTQASNLHLTILTCYFDKTGRINAMQAGSLYYFHPILRMSEKFNIMKKILLIFPLLILLSACGGDAPKTERKTVPQISDIPPGKLIYKQHCVLCHGTKGDMGLNGSVDLTASKLTTEEATEVITNGRNTMMAYKETLKKNEIADVVKYIKTLRK